MALIEFDPKANAMYIRLKDGKVVDSEPLADNIVIDIGENGEVIGIEVLLPKLDERRMNLLTKVAKAKV